MVSAALWYLLIRVHRAKLTADPSVTRLTLPRRVCIRSMPLDPATADCMNLPTPQGGFSSQG